MKKITFLFALLCASVMGFAIDWSGYAWIGNGSGNAAYTDKFKMTLAEGQALVNIQSPGFATAPGIYTTFPAGIISCTLPASAYDVQGAGMILHVDAFTAQETEITVVHGTGTAVFTVYYADGTTGGGGDPEPTEIYDTNFALVSLGASATSDNGGTANNAIDGNDGSSWESTHGVDAVKLTIDLGQKRIFNTVQIRWEGAYGKAFTIDVSNDGTDWTTVKSVDETLSGFPHEQTLEFAKTTAKYIRFNGIERGTQWGYNMFSFRVLLPDVSTLTSINLTAPATIAQIGGAGVALTAQPKDQNGQNMEAEVSWEITPAAAGHMSGSTFIPDQAGSATIRAYNGEIFSPAVSIIGVASANLALSTNISTDNKIVAQSAVDPNGSQYDAFYAVDGNLGSVWQGRPDGISGGDDAARTFDSWFVVDLGAFYNIDLVALHFEGACSELYHIDFSANNTDWNLGYNLVGAGGINARNDYWTELDNNTKVRYVRFWSTKAATEWGMKLFEFEVYGTEWSSGDEEKPVMVSASLVSSTINSAVIAVSATDNDEVARFHVVDGTNGIDANYTPSEGKITITGLTHNTAYNFTITAKDASNNESANTKEVAVTTPFDGSINLALNQPCEAGYTNTNPAEQAGAANDGNDGTNWNTYADRPASEEWWYVDLGNIYNLTNITIYWGGTYSTNYILQARVDAPSAADKADDAAWVTLASVTDAAADAEKSTDVSGVGRYVRIHSLAKSSNFFRVRDAQAVIAVAATDNQGIANYHVVDAGNSFDANFAAEAGNITVTGLTGGTNYTLVITAVDFFGNESENSKSVAVNTTAHLTAPDAACPAPTWDASLVKAMYSPTYNADYNHQDWNSGTVATEDEFGRKYVTNNNGYFGADGFSLNCLMMEKLHYDIWIENDATIRFVPIWGAGKPEQGITVNLAGQQWNSIDINLSEYSIITDWSNIYQMKIDQASNLTFWVANAYFYREAPYVDNVAPTNASASVAAEGFYSVQITAQAEDNSGAVSFKVMNGDVQLATGAAASGAATTIVVNGLALGTNYNFNVVAYDEAGNEAAPVAVAATTKALPASAPEQTEEASNVKALYSDVYTPVVAVENYCEWWWESPTVHTNYTLGEGDHVLFYDNNHQEGASFGWAWSGDNKINFSGYQKLHMSIYPTQAGTIEVYPVVAGVTTNKVSETLTANQWNEVVLDYTDKTFAPLNQIGFINFYGLGEFFVDNVYFFREPGYTRNVTNGNYGTICLPQAGEIVGATLYEIADYANNMIYVDEVEGGVMEAGKPYIFQATSDKLNVYYTSATVEETAGSANGLHGFYNLENENAQFDIPEDAGNYILYQNQYWLVKDRAAYIANFRAYIVLDDITPKAAAPGIRRVAMQVNGQNTTTGVDNLNAGETPVKVMINGQEKMYDTTGRLVK